MERNNGAALGSVEKCGCRIGQSREYGGVNVHSSLLSEPVRQRARGVLDVAFSTAGATRRFEEGAAKVRFPAKSEAVLINTAGGIAGGDEFRWSINAEASCGVSVTTQACEKFYRSHGPPARIATHLAVEKGARLDWLPQESIVFDGARIERTLDVDLADDARLLAVEAFVFGRVAMGETRIAGSLRERWRIRRDGGLIFADTLALEGPLSDRLDKPAIAAGGRALATVLLCSADAENLAARARVLLDNNGAALSVFDGKLVARIVARDGYSLRCLLIPLLTLLKDSPLPKLWTL
jgi:urease accessory protein